MTDELNIKEIFDKKIAENDAKWFYNLFEEGDYSSAVDEDEFTITKLYKQKVAKWKKFINTTGNCSTVFSENWGDGREQTIVFEFPTIQKFVMITGIYSSYNSSEWESVCYSVPYTHTEIRYKQE